MLYRLTGRCWPHRWEYICRNPHGYIGQNGKIIGHSRFECRNCKKVRIRYDHHMTMPTLEQILRSRQKRSLWDKFLDWL